MATADETSGAVARVYADIALAGYEDSLLRAGLLQQAVTDLIETPSDATLTAAREAWNQR
ncbi:MAG: peptidase, partial [Rhodospirillales bacterium]|nr:peptidase [Rhodospirillales bacterium]